MKKSKTFLPYLFLFIALVSISCKKVLYTNNTDKVVKVRKVDFKQLKAKAKFSFQQDGGKINTKANIRIKRDSIIWINLSSLGIEGVRIKILKKGLYYINRLTKESFSYSFAYLTKKYHFAFSYAQIEKLLLSELLIFPKNKLKKISDNISNNISNNKGIARYGSEHDDFTALYTVQKDSAILKTAEYQKINAQQKLAVDYQDYKVFDNVLFPKNLRLAFSTLDRELQPLNLVFNINFTKIEISNKKLKYPYTVPKKYELIEYLQD